jgi:uncharacterized protein (DUF58 family)
MRGFLHARPIFRTLHAPRSVLTPELLRRLRRLDLRTRGLVDAFLGGQYHSAFKGSGMTFSEVRPYSVGDDVRALDWNVTARTGEAFVKVFEEERELTVLLVVDVSGSAAVGTQGRTKRDVAAEAAALITFSAIQNGDQVGLALFAGRVERYVAPGKSRPHGLRLLRDVFAFEAESEGTDLAGVLTFVRRILHRRAVVVLISDFHADGYLRPLAALAARHDVVALHVADLREHTLPDVGLVMLEDAETGAPVTLDTSNARVRATYEQRARARLDATRRTFARAGVDHVLLRTGDDLLAPLSTFFARRVRRHASRRTPARA